MKPVIRVGCIAGQYAASFPEDSETRDGYLACCLATW